jgi:maltooligosyltrehalose trehalohydrolase
MRGRWTPPVGADVVGEGEVRFRTWAPGKQRVEVVLEEEPGRGERAVELSREAGGFWSAQARGAGPGTRYRYRLDGEDTLCPDPWARALPEGPFGPSEVIDPTRFAWTDAGWQGRPLREAVLYELHVGTYTPDGTWAAAMAHLPALARTGITVIELMPVASFAGAFGWGYDGVAWFAPYHGYGAPDDLRRFVDRAHDLGLAVILDVVYNHFGPDGSWVPRFAPELFSTRHDTDWGAAPDFDGPHSGPVREIVAANARHWIEEYHFDGLRLDATQDLHDEGEGEHIVARITRAVREGAPSRATLVIAENERQEAHLVAPPDERVHGRAGAGLDALWNDDFHHAARVALTGRDEAYYGDYQGTAQELASTLRHGFLFQGQRYAWQSRRRGSPALGLDPGVFVTYLQNHDQVANSLDGRRLHQLTSPARHRAMLTLLLLGPGTPLLFQGEELLADAPFLYFADHQPELASAVRRGREVFLAQFPSLALPGSRARLPDPGARATFERCRIDHGARARHAPHVAMVERLLALRRGERAISGEARRGHDAAALSEPGALVLRYLGEQGADDRLVVLNLGPTRRLASIPEPLVAPPSGMRWREVFASEDPAWGGRGCPPVECDEGWELTAECAVLLAPEPSREESER